MAKGRILIACGIFVAALATVILLAALRNAVPVLLGYVVLVQYAQYMMEAQLIVHSILFIVLSVPALFLIRHGMRVLREARDLPARCDE